MRRCSHRCDAMRGTQHAISAYVHAAYNRRRASCSIARKVGVQSVALRAAATCAFRRTNARAQHGTGPACLQPRFEEVVAELTNGGQLHPSQLYRL